MVPFSIKNADFELNGYTSKIAVSRSNRYAITAFINGRYVKNKILSDCVIDGYHEFLLENRYPYTVLYVKTSASLLDVNVHPSKMNVKFAQPSRIYDLVYSAIREAIFDALNPKTTKKENETIEKKEFKDNLIKVDIGSLKEIEIEPTTQLENKPPIITLKQETFSPITMFDMSKNDQSTKSPIIEQTKITEEISSKQQNDYVEASSMSNIKIIGELFNEFILLEKGEDLIIMDFHAGHERLNYDKFSKLVNERDVVVQDLLVPYIQDLSLQEVEFIMSLKEDLNKLGFDIDEFGDKKIKINSVPLQLKDINLKNFVDDLLHDMKNLKPSMNNEINNYLMQKACKSSVKSGMTLSKMEIEELLKNLDMKHPVLLCPHGRPVITVVNKNQIEKWFKRIV